MEFLRAINALMNRGSFFIASAQLQSRIINAIHNKGGNTLLCCKPLAYTHATRKFPTGNLQKNSKHCLCHDTCEIHHTFLSSVWLNFHREVSLTLSRFFFGYSSFYRRNALTFPAVFATTCYG